jgi:hypothetical protein
MRTGLGPVACGALGVAGGVLGGVMACGPPGATETVLPLTTSVRRFWGELDVSTASRTCSAMSLVGRPVINDFLGAAGAVGVAGVCGLPGSAARAGKLPKASKARVRPARAKWRDVVGDWVPVGVGGKRVVGMSGGPCGSMGVAVFGRCKTHTNVMLSAEKPHA